MTFIQFTVLGRPQPAGSKKGFIHPHTQRVVIVDDAKKSRPWKQEVGHTAQAAMQGRPLLTGPLSLTLEFFLRRPKGHYGSGRNQAVLKPSAPTWPTTKPDATKLLRAVEDALTGVVYKDDAQIVAQHVFKEYGATERVEITVRDLSHEHMAVAA